MRFRFAPRSMTLSCISLNFLGILRYFAFWEATTAKGMKIDPHCQRWNCCALKVLFSAWYITIYVDIAGRSSARGDLVSFVLYTKAVARLGPPLRYQGFLVL